MYSLTLYIKKEPRVGCVRSAGNLFLFITILLSINVNDAQVVTVCRDTQDYCPSLVAICSGLGSLCPLTCGQCTPTPPAQTRPDGPITDAVCNPIALGCDFACEMSEGVGICSCPVGLTLAEDGMGCDDVNECEADNPCVEPGFTVCLNSHGSFRCEDDSRCEFRQDHTYYYKRDGCCRITSGATCGKNVVSGNLGAGTSGPNVVLGFWPWIAYVRIGSTVCTGTLIDEQWLLIAAHCMGGYFGESIVATVATRSTKSGSENFRTAEFSIDEIEIHPNYNYPFNDVALLRLDSRVELSEFVRPACLPHGEIPREELKCFFAGYEANFFQQGVVRNLVDAQITVRNASRCSGLSLPGEGLEDSQIMCVEITPTQAEMCPGETSGSMVCQRCTTCDWFVAGIYSFGDICSSEDSFAAFTGVENYEDWIGRVTRERILKDGPCQASVPVFRPWGAWSSCDQTCGRSSRSRSRVCVSNGIERPASDCRGHSDEVGPCPNRPCPRWGQFTQWSSCTRSCGQEGGTRSRTRSCINGIQGQIGCDAGGSFDLEVCNQEICAEWSRWTSWSSCVGTCGRTTMRVATRTCIGATSTQICEGSSSRTRNCNLPRCPSWSPWSGWSGCSRSCGEGISHRRRNCRNGNSCPGEAREEVSCVTRECPGRWQSWSQWSDCNTTCGQGFMTRSRECIGGMCGGNSMQMRQCRNRDCIGWTRWETWGPCSVPCGQGIRTRRRAGCNGGSIGSSVCPGSISENGNCTNVACDEPQWSQWSDCSRLCGTGSRTRNRVCPTCVSSNEQQTEFCNQKDCARLGSCNALRDQPMTRPSCGEIMLWCSQHSQFMRANCQKTCCDAEVYETWSSWGPCSETCGTGSQARFRRCSLAGNCSNPDLTDLRQVRRCDREPCESDTRILPQSSGSTTQIQAWGSWSSCNAICGHTSTRFRLRGCEGTNCVEEERQVDTCLNDDNCGGSWSSWSQPSSCDVTCGSGIATRKRQCINGNLCPGPKTSTEVCNNPPCNGVCLAERDFAGQEFCFNHQHLCASKSYILNCAYTCCRVFNRKPICTDLWLEPVCRSNSLLCGFQTVKSNCQRTCNTCI